jgi:hypothetical protein
MNIEYFSDEEDAAFETISLPGVVHADKASICHFHCLSQMPFHQRYLKCFNILLVYTLQKTDEFDVSVGN